MTGFDIGEPDLWDAVDEAVDRIQEPLEFPVGNKSGTVSPSRDNGGLSVNPDTRLFLSASSEEGR